MTPKPLAFIIEDDPVLCDINSITLEPYFRLEVYQRGDFAMNALEKTVPDLVLLDINLPKVSGVEILKKLRTSKRFSTTKVILTTADNLQAASLESEADIVLLKPINPNQLRAFATRLTSASA